jgi:hypothetical protein
MTARDRPPWRRTRRLFQQSTLGDNTTMAEGQSMTVADVVAKTMDGRLEDFVREAVVLVAGELMEGEISAEIGAALGEVAPDTCEASQRVSAAGVGDEGRGDRAAGREEAAGLAVLPLVPGAATPERAGDHRGCAGGVCQRREHEEGRPARRAAGDRRDDQGPRLGTLPGVGRTGPSFRQRPLEGAYPYLWLDANRSRCVITAGSCPRPSSWPTRCTSPACAR